MRLRFAIHGFACLHSPPEGRNDKLAFLLFLAATVVAVKRRARLLRASVATRGNDMRLGGNEAPPAVISVYLGETIDEVMSQIFVLYLQKEGNSTNGC